MAGRGEAGLWRRRPVHLLGPLPWSICPEGGGEAVAGDGERRCGGGSGKAGAGGRGKKIVGVVLILVINLVGMAAIVRIWRRDV